MSRASRGSTTSCWAARTTSPPTARSPRWPSRSRRTAASAEKLFNENLGTGRWLFHDEILAYFGDFEVLDPGLVPVAEWRPGPDDQAAQGITYHTLVGGVARKPDPDPA
ncbi:SAM-dependent methyltransferase [Nonomuraea cavernae]|uniref:SAM-dependent methyltransferase n=1 Tax=Nonomuraea cavernae TaxID=2045107 RepID=UPI0033FE93AB